MAKRKASNKRVDPFPTTAKQDYPISKWETEGRAKYEALQKNKPKGGLSKYELYLLQHHFPQQEQQSATDAAQRRKEERIRRHAKPGLAGGDASDGDSPPPASQSYVRKVPVTFIF